MSVKRTKNGRWLVCIRDRRGQWFPRKRFERKVDAQAYEATLIEQKNEGVLVPNKTFKNLNLSQYFGLWIKECRSNVSDGWLITQKQVYRDHIEPVLGHIKFIEIHKRDIQEVLLKAKAKGLSGQTRAHIYGILRKMFDDGINHYELINFNPVLKKLKPRIISKERNFLNIDDAWKLLNYSKKDWFGVPIWICTLTGMRIGEVQFLKWKHIDFNGQRILIQGTYNKKVKKMQPYPKQKNHGAVPMPQPLIDFLRGLKGSQEAYVASGIKTERLNYDSYNKALKRACKEVGVKVLQTHELRHTAAMLYLANGASREDIRAILNHSNTKVTETYIHSTDSQLRQVVDRIKSPKAHLQIVS